VNDLYWLVSEGRFSWETGIASIAIIIRYHAQVIIVAASEMPVASTKSRTSGHSTTGCQAAHGNPMKYQRRILKIQDPEDWEIHSVDRWRVIYVPVFRTHQHWRAPKKATRARDMRACLYFGAASRSSKF